MSRHRIALAHGFTQTARSWAIVEALLHDRISTVETTAVDLPGHGSAGGVRTDLWGAADHLVSSAGPGTFVGYSMGGRVALHAALSHPEEVHRLVLIGATAGLADDAQRAERRDADEALAARIETGPLDEFIDVWLRNPLFAGLSPETALRSDRLRNTADGLASSLRLCGTGTQASLWGRLSEIRCPTLILVGEHDAKFRELGERLAAGIDRAEVTVIADAGHSVHLEQPATTVEAIADFLEN